MRNQILAFLHLVASVTVLASLVGDEINCREKVHDSVGAITL